MPNERAGDPGNRGSTIADLAGAAGPGSIDGRHLLLVGAGPGLGMAVARRFAVGGYRVTLVARSTDRLGDLAGTLADTGAKINTIAADAGDPDGLGARMKELYRTWRTGRHRLWRRHGSSGPALSSSVTCRRRIR